MPSTIDAFLVHASVHPIRNGIGRWLGRVRGCQMRRGNGHPWDRIDLDVIARLESVDGKWNGDRRKQIRDI